jgi:hypothetical protein
MLYSVLLNWCGVHAKFLGSHANLSNSNTRKCLQIVVWVVCIVHKNQDHPPPPKEGLGGGHGAFCCLAQEHRLAYCLCHHVSRLCVILSALYTLS